MPKQIFILGSTGYLGGSILTQLLEHLEGKIPSQYEITCLVRTREKGTKVNGVLGIHPLVGDMDSRELLAEQAANSDIVIAAADADNLDAVKAIFEGFRRRQRKNKAIYIHTSGCYASYSARIG